MVKVTLLGDSIRLIGYGAETVRLLGEGYEVFQPEDNCRFCKYTLRGLFDWEADMKGSEIVHWNNGLWDICRLFGDGTFTTETEYVETMLRIADILQARYKKVIFATTTPVRKENPYNSNEDIKRFNDLIVPKLKARGIVINDLYALLCEDIDRYIADDLLHLSEEGIQVCAKQVANIIKDNVS
ncbi:MAG: SGNH/GDSL hydrolase family protein [Clostridia bacterium]|nr:SGNH/GDSL hydrolase family protein [Clostridia bacterium]